MIDFIAPIDKCMSPVKLRSHDGTFSYYPCGHCLNCLSSRQASWARKLNFELNSPNVFALFITLTYSNDHLPLLHYDKDNSIVNFSRTKFSRNGSFSRVFEAPSFEERVPDYSLYFKGSPLCFPHFVADRRGDSLVFDDSNTFAIPYLPDIQDFIKRLRTNIDRTNILQDEDTSFKYFICSEYGPKTFRPHYHGILFFRSSRVAQYAHRRLIIKSWGKCKNDKNQSSHISKWINRKKGISAYVSKYVTCFADLPYVLRTPFTRPFYTFSKSSPIGSEFLSINDSKKLVSEGDIISHTSFYDKNKRQFVPIDSPYPRCLWSRIFPEFYSYGDLSPDFFREVILHLYHISRSNFPIPNYIHSTVTRYNVRHELINPYGTNTFGAVIGDIISHPHALDIYCFGIPQNYTASKKIISNFRSGVYSDASLFLDDYLRYRYLKFKSSFENFVDYCNIYSFDNFSISPAVVLFLYPNLTLNLPYELSSFDKESYIFYSRILKNGFSLNIEDFYPDGKLIIPYRDDFVFSNYSSYVRLSRLKHKSTVKYKYNQYQDL